MSANVITSWSDPPPIKVGDFIDIRYYDFTHPTDASGQPVVRRSSGMVLRIKHLPVIRAVYITLQSVAPQVMDGDGWKDVKRSYRELTDEIAFLVDSSFGIWVRSSADNME